MFNVISAVCRLSLATPTKPSAPAPMPMVACRRPVPVPPVPSTSAIEPRAGSLTPPRDRDAERRALARDRRDVDPTAVESDEVPDQRQPDAEATLLAGGAAVELEERLEDLLDVAGKDAHALVDHREGDLRGRGLQPYGDRVVVVDGELGGVGDQAEQPPLHLRGVGLAGDRLLGQDEGQRTPQPILEV